LNDVERPSGVKNATILMALGGIILIYSGYQFYYYFTISVILVSPLFGISLIVLGVLSLCASLVIWQQKVWATKLIAGIGIAVCGTFAIFGIYLGFYLGIIVFALWYYAVLDYTRKGLTNTPTE
jgi:uncharacterized membrane protein HdeD (DUF308 family)